jgi:hypothetical protein
MTAKRRKPRRFPETQIRLRQILDELRLLQGRIGNVEAQLDKWAAHHKLPPYQHA